jgi:hypothetical protein
MNNITTHGLFRVCADVYDTFLETINIDPRFDKMRMRGMHEDMVVYDWVIREVYDKEEGDYV